ncbi:MAG: hypothetical protein KGI75_10495 [Rhizobiaceae bacterium]|nr:hypothetical protein [Rhizobiaceae bacterium]
MLDRSAFYLIIAGLGLSMASWASKDDFESNRPVTQPPALAELTPVTPTRPIKDDILVASLEEPTATAVPEVKPEVVAAVVPIPRPVYAPAQSAAVPKHTEDAASFEKCLPACDTRDPMVASNRAAPDLEDRPEIDEQPDVVVERVGLPGTLLHGGRDLVSDALGASRHAIGLGRSTVAALVEVVR